MSALNVEIRKMQAMEYFGFGPEVMKKTRVCPKCGKPAESERIFCKECGCRLPKETLYDLYKERHKICSNCKTVLGKEMEYCPQCGMKIDY